MDVDKKPEMSKEIPVNNESVLQPESILHKETVAPSDLPKESPHETPKTQPVISSFDQIQVSILLKITIYKLLH